jgi:precorrin-6Y C5,15-methyltransferase (decarboxylating)
MVMTPLKRSTPAKDVRRETVVTVVGMGTSRKHLNPEVLEAVRHADVLIGDRRHLKAFLDLSCEKVQLKGNLDAIVRLVEQQRKTRRIVLLASGDPNFYGIARRIRKAVGKEHVHIIPNVTSLQAAFAKINESWEDAHVVSLHGRDAPHIASLLEHHQKLFLLTDRKHTPRQIAKEIVRQDERFSSTRTYVFENLGTNQERVTADALVNLTRKTFDPLNVMILIQDDVPAASTVAGHRFGLPDEAFDHEKGLITKAEVRVLTLAKLRLTGGCVMWDIGAGSGSISVEAALLFPSGHVFAIERSSQRMSQLKKNVRKFHVGNVIPVLGDAPKALLGLPSPHCIVVGGSGGKLGDIISYCKGVISPKGRIVINVATAETLSLGLSLFDQRSWTVDATLVTIARMHQVGSRHGFQALNPVFIIDAEKKK